METRAGNAGEMSTFSRAQPAHTGNKAFVQHLAIGKQRETVSRTAIRCETVFFFPGMGIGEVANVQIHK